MKVMLGILIVLFSSVTHADSDGNICINENQVSIEAKDVYFLVSENSKHTITFSDGNIERTNTTNNMLTNCLSTIDLPYSKSQSVILFQDSQHIISLVVSTNTQFAKRWENGSMIFHHFVARVVKNKIYGDFVESLILGESSRLETVH